MTREEVYNECINSVDNKSLMLELPTGYGKTKLAIDIVNHLCSTVYEGSTPNILLLVAKIVHKQTWKDEFKKWGGTKAHVTMECYESLRKHQNQKFNFILMDEVHHIKSDVRLSLLKTIKYDYMFGLSATIPKNLKNYLRFHYHSKFISCDISEAIEEDILPEPEIILFPLDLENTRKSETIEINAKSPGAVVHGEYKDIWKYKRSKTHAILTCTQAQKMKEIDSLIEWEKNKYMTTRNPGMERSWLYHCGKRLEYLANFKNSIVWEILQKLRHYRTITFCKTIEQSEVLGKNCIHSKNNKSTAIYDKFNQKKINHITAVNILNENANLVDCKYAIFANLSSSDIIIPQRLGRSMRHKKPVIIVPYYKNTREEEIVKKMFKDYNREFIRIVYSIKMI